MADNKIDLILDLDKTGFARAITESKASVEGLIGTLEGVAKVGGVIGAAYLAVKTAFDLTVEAEQIKSINAQFEILTKQAGVAGDALKEALNTAADGLISDNDLIQLANRSLVDFNGNVTRLPEIMELARKASVLMGTDVATAFNELSHAIATGQTRKLKEIGIMIDAEKAYRDYARSVGLTASVLSDADKRQAIMNQALEQGQQKLGNIDTSIKQTTDAWTKLKNVLGDIKESAATAFDGIAGEKVKNALQWMEFGAKEFKTFSDSHFSEGSDKIRAKLKVAQDDIAMYTDQLFEAEEKIRSGGVWNSIFGPTDADIAGIQIKINAAKAEIGRLKSALGEDAETNVDEKTLGPNPGDKDLKLKQEAQFQKDLLAIRQEAFQAKLATMQTEAQAEAAFEEQKQLILAQTKQRLISIDSADLTEEQKLVEKQRILQLETQQIAAAEQTKLDIKLKALDQYQKAATGNADGIARGFEVGSKRAQIAQQQFGNVGERVFSSFSSNATSALQAWGAGAKSAGDAAKGFIFGMLADEAAARGQLMLAASIWPPNPLGLAGGAALMALSGWLRSQAGGGASSAGSAPSASASSGSSSSGVASASTADKPEVDTRIAPKAVTIQVQGNYFETDQTKQRLVEMVRDAQDATDFSIRSIG